MNVHYTVTNSEKSGKIGMPGRMQLEEIQIKIKLIIIKP